VIQKSTAKGLIEETINSTKMAGQVTEGKKRSLASLQLDEGTVTFVAILKISYRP